DLIVTGVQTCALPIYSYSYDLAGNRTSEQHDVGYDADPAPVTKVTTSSYGLANELNSRVVTGPFPVRIVGTVSEPAIVTVNGVRSEERRVGKGGRCRA